MELESQNYGGQIFRPRPEIICDPDDAFVAVGTPWGEREVVNETLLHLRDLVLSSQGDLDITSPFEKVESLSSLGNQMKTAFRLTNEKILNEQNNGEYTVGMEVFAASKDHNLFVWGSLGSYHLLLNRAGSPLYLLDTHHDLTFELGKNSPLCPPLPCTLLGLHPTLQIPIQSLRLQPNDQFFILQRSYLPPQLWTLPPESRTLPNLVDLLAKDNPDLPFWIGSLGTKFLFA